MVAPSGTGGSPAPIDRPILESLETHLQTTDHVSEAIIPDEKSHHELRVTLTDSYYPGEVRDVRVTIRWYTNDDFTIHYREEYPDQEWDCRWDRHPNPHNSRDHFHPPPDARTPGEDASWPTDYRDVVSLIFDEIETRVATLWTTK